MEQQKIGIGIIGCGVISAVYMTNLTEHYKNVEILACSDIIMEKAVKAAERFNVPKACTNAELLAIDEIQIVLNLTNPSAHYEVDMEILNAGKHLYCEKPLCLEIEQAKEVVALAAEKGLMAVGAPDTFLGAGGQSCITYLDQDLIGKPIGFTCSMTSPGHELWHPDPAFHFQPGGGPMFDMGPYYMTMLTVLLGPIKRISCFATSGRPMRNVLGEWVETQVPTHYTGIMEMECGAIGTITMSLDTWHAEIPLLELYGTKGYMTVPDPNQFSGSITFFDGEQLRDIVDSASGDSPIPHVPAKLLAMLTSNDKCTYEKELLFPHSESPMENFRGLGVCDMAQSLIDGRKCRLDPNLSLHVVEALNAFEISAKTGKAYEMTTTCSRPEQMGADWELWEVK